MTFLEKLDSLKKKHGLNNRTLSINTGIPYTTIDSFYKKGFRNMKFETLEKLARYFHVSLDYLMNDEITTDDNFEEGQNLYLDYLRLKSGEREIVLSPDEIKIITAYRNTDEGYKKAIQRILRIDEDTKNIEQQLENLYTENMKLKSSAKKVSILAAHEGMPARESDVIQTETIKEMKNHDLDMIKGEIT